MRCRRHAPGDQATRGRYQGGGRTAIALALTCAVRFRVGDLYGTAACRATDRRCVGQVRFTAWIDAVGEVDHDDFGVHAEGCCDELGIKDVHQVGQAGAARSSALAPPPRHFGSNHRDQVPATVARLTGDEPPPSLSRSRPQSGANYRRKSRASRSTRKPMPRFVQMPVRICMAWRSLSASSVRIAEAWARWSGSLVSPATVMWWETSVHNGAISAYSW